MISSLLILTVSPTEPKYGEWARQTQLHVEKVLDRYGFDYKEFYLDKQKLTKSDLISDSGTRKYRAVFFIDRILSDYLSEAELGLIMDTAVSANINIVVSEPLGRTFQYAGLGASLEWDWTLIGSDASNWRVYFGGAYGSYNDTAYGIRGLYLRKYVCTTAFPLVWVSDGRLTYPILTVQRRGPILISTISVALNIVGFYFYDDIFVATIACAIAFTQTLGDILQNDNRLATIIADDFSFQQSERQEFFKYVDALTKTNAAGDIAFVGVYASSKDKALDDSSVSLARSNSYELEILNHGVRHNYREFNGTMEQVISNATAALDAMNQLRSKTGLSYAPLIVAPGGYNGNWTFEGFEQVGLLGGFHDGMFSNGIEHVDPYTGSTLNLPVVKRDMIGNETGSAPLSKRAPLMNTRLILGEWLFRSPLVVYVHPSDFSGGNEWLVSFIRRSQLLGYTWVKTSALFWKWRKYVFDPVPGEYRLNVAGSVFPRLSVGDHMLFYDLRTLSEAYVIARNETSTFALIASNATLLATLATEDSVTLTVRDVVNLPATVSLYSPCIPSVKGAKSWNYNEGLLQILIKDPSSHTSLSEVTISCAILTKLPTLTALSQPSNLAFSQWMLCALGVVVIMGLTIAVFITRNRAGKSERKFDRGKE
jgi:hypothetical protein